jgi:hypothetical protein
MGYQFPVGENQAANAVVLEFTYIPKVTSK